MCILQNSDFVSENDVSDSDSDFVPETSEGQLSSVGDMFANFLTAFLNHFSKLTVKMSPRTNG